MADISQINIEEMIRKYGEEKIARLMNVIMENNVMMLKLQKKILELQVVAEEKKKDQKRRQEDREQRIKEQRRSGDGKRCEKEE